MLLRFVDSEWASRFLVLRTGLISLIFRFWVDCHGFGVWIFVGFLDFIAWVFGLFVFWTPDLSV